MPGSVVVPAAGGAEAAWQAAAELAGTGRAVTLVAHATPLVELPGVAVEVWDPGDVDLDPAPLVAVAGEILAWGGLPG